MEPKSRDVAMVFQNYALYPHMKVFDNMAFSLKLAKVAGSVIQEKVAYAAQILNLTPYLDRYPRQLSGGQRQRVAMGRAIVRNPKVFLFDEPLSNLDAQLRVQMRTEIKALHQRLGSTSIYVTHDQIEAMTMADKIVVMRDGHIEQAGPPLEVYDRPCNLFVASFIGSPAMNLIQGAAQRGKVPGSDRGRHRAAAADCMDPTARRSITAFDRTTSALATGWGSTRSSAWSSRRARTRWYSRRSATRRSARRSRSVTIFGRAIVLGWCRGSIASIFSTGSRVST